VTVPVLVLGLMLALLSGCATHKTANEGRDAMERRNWDAAVFKYLELVAKDPDNVEYRIGLRRARHQASQEHFQRGLAFRQMGRLAAARDEMEMAIQLDPSNQYAEQILEDVQQELEVLSRPGGDVELEEMKRRAREAKVQPPILDPRSKEPISLIFPKPKPVKEIYDALGKAYGFNVIFDPKLKDDRIPVELRDVTAERALEIVMQAAGHFYKVLDEHTIIIAEDSPQNRREYEDLVIKTFFLSNAEVKDVDKLLRSLIEARRLATNEQLNAITLRDTADKVAIAEKLIAVSDKAKAEVLVDVELMEVGTTRQSDIGMALSTYSFTLQADTTMVNPDSPAGVLPLDDLGDISRENVFINVPSVIVNLVKSSGNSTILAQPQLRITEGEKASLHLGDRVPIPVTSFNTGNTVGGNVVPITSFQYQDIGIKIDVEPRVHHNREVTLNLTVEVSQLGETVPVGPEQSAVTIGTRTITSVIRLRSGESSLLAGLLREDFTEGVTKTPLLSDIPFLGRLFTSKSKQSKVSDLVLTLTPHIIRFPDIEEQDLAPLWVGTESRISYFGSRSPRVQSGRSPEGPFDRSTDKREPGEQKTTPYGIRGRGGSTRRIAPPSEGEEGIELVPREDSFGGRSAGTGPQDDEAESDADGVSISKIDPSRPPLIVGLEPSVVSLPPDGQTTLQLVVRDAPGPYRLPLGLSFDPNRVAIDSIEPAVGVDVLEGAIEPDNGWLTLDLMVPDGRDTAQAVAAIRIRAVSPGPAPLVFTSAGAIVGDGSMIPVASNDGALFVTEVAVEED
jgi:general secretion pathway protein D